MLRRPSSIALRLAVLGLTAAVPAVGLTATPASAAASIADDTAFDALLARYERLVAAITAGGGLFEQDRPVVRSVLREIEGFLADNPGDPRALAMDLQLSLWLDEDPDRIAARYAELVTARPADAALALAALRWQSAEGRLEDEQLDAAWAELAARFPESPEIALEHVRRLKDEVRYEAMLEVLDGIDLAAAEQPELLVLKAEALFAEHRFDEALATLDDLGELGAMQFRLRTRSDELRDWISQASEGWRLEQEKRAAEASADDLPRAAIETDRGTVVVELFENDAPNTVANFISLAEQGFYDGTGFHRFLADFMVQGGDANSRPGAEGTPGTGNPGYRIPDEHGEGFTPRHHFNDSLAMANTGAPDSGGSQFYLNHKPTPWLDGRHTVFGRVIDGRDVARSLRADDRILTVRVLRKRDHAYEPQTIAIAPPAGVPAPAPATEGEGEGDGEG
ncbi:MAG: peptidylprolyl isomerase [Planctomycetota bacterium]|jgi:peptidyl-prolyl cis-trans isomerase B (cyclophilin B)